MESELDSGGENPVDIENLIWFSSQISPQNWSPFFLVMQSRSQDANTGDVKVLSTKAGQMQCKIPPPGEHNTKCWKMPLKCAWGKLQLMRRTQNTIHPLRFLGICVKHYPHPLSTLRICLLEPQPIQGVKHKLPDPRVNRQDGIPLRQHASLNVWSQRLDFVH